MAYTLRSGIVINEILVDPNGAINFDTDGNGTADSTDEYVELYNASGVAIDIGGLQLWDQGNGNWFTFDPGTILQPGAHALVMTGLSGGSLPTGDPDDLFFEAGRGSAVINNGGDTVTLLDPDAGEYVQARFNAGSFHDPTTFTGFPAATQVGAGENFGSDTDGQSLQRAGDGADIFQDDAPTPGTTNICYVNGSLVAKPNGDRPVEDLCTGDQVTTADNGAQVIRWVLRRRWTAGQLRSHPNLAPIKISAGALGPGLPIRDLYVSQQHRVLARGKIAARMFGTTEVLVPAKALLALDGVTVDRRPRDLTYVHIALSDHELLIAEGIAAESLYLGMETAKALPPAARRELAVIFGATTDTLEALFSPVRPLVKGKKAKQFAARHLRNGRDLVGANP